MKDTELTGFDRIMAAVSFTEAAEFETARELFMNTHEKEKNTLTSPIHQKRSADPEKREHTFMSNRQKASLGVLMMTGIISIGLYIALLTNQTMLNDNFAKGGLYAFLPIITAFVFSYFHGTFTGHFWTVLGVEASRKKMEVK